MLRDASAVACLTLSLPGCGAAVTNQTSRADVVSVCNRDTLFYSDSEIDILIDNFAGIRDQGIRRDLLIQQADIECADRWGQGTSQHVDCFACGTAVVAFVY